MKLIKQSINYMNGIIKQLHYANVLVYMQLSAVIMHSVSTSIVRGGTLKLLTARLGIIPIQQELKLIKTKAQHSNGFSVLNVDRTHFTFIIEHYESNVHSLMYLCMSFIFLDPYFIYVYTNLITLKDFKEISIKNKCVNMFFNVLLQNKTQEKAAIATTNKNK